MNARRARAVAVITAAVAAGADARADQATADRLAADAQARGAQGDFTGAARLYRDAFAAHPRPDFMCNVGVAYYKAKDLPRAHRYLGQCLAIGTSLDARFLSDVKKVLEAVEQRLGAGEFTPVDLLVQPSVASISLASPAEASGAAPIEGPARGVPLDEPLIGAGRVWVPYGRYRLLVHAEGFVDRELDIDARNRSAIAASVALVRAAATGASSGDRHGGAGAQPPAASSQVPVSPPVPDQIGAEHRTPATTVARPRAAIVASFASVALGGGALALYLRARQLAAEAGDAETMEQWLKARDSARTHQRVSWAIGALAGAGALASGILWYRWARVDATVDVAPGGPVAVTVSGRW